MSGFCDVNFRTFVVQGLGFSDVRGSGFIFGRSGFGRWGPHFGRSGFLDVRGWGFSDVRGSGFHFLDVWGLDVGGPFLDVQGFLTFRGLFLDVRGFRTLGVRGWTPNVQTPNDQKPRTSKKLNLDVRGPTPNVQTLNVQKTRMSISGRSGLNPERPRPRTPNPERPNPECPSVSGGKEP